MVNELSDHPRHARPGVWAIILAVCGAVVFLVPVLLLPVSTAVPPIV